MGIVNTGEDTFRAGSGVSGFINVCLTRSQTSLESSPPPSVIPMSSTTRQSASQPWGFRLQGGKDRGLPFQLLKVPLDSIASHSGAKSGDYLVKIGGHDVFHLNHEEAKELIRQGGNKLLLVVERGEKIVPSLNSAFPKPKEETVEKPKSYSQEVLERTGRLPGQKEQGFTTVGKQKLASKQYNSPMAMYSEDVLEEIMQQGTALGKEIDPNNPWNMTGKEFDPTKSGVLSAIMEREPEAQPAHHHLP